MGLDIADRTLFSLPIHKVGAAQTVVSPWDGCRIMVGKCCQLHQNYFGRLRVPACDLYLQMFLGTPRSRSYCSSGISIRSEWGWRTPGRAEQKASNRSGWRITLEPGNFISSMPLSRYFHMEYIVGVCYTGTTTMSRKIHKTKRQKFDSVKSMFHRSYPPYQNWK